VSLGEYLVGAAYFIVTMAASAAIALIVLRRRYPYLAGLSRLIAFAVLMSAAVIFVHVLPAALGLLARGSVLLTALVCLGAAWALVRPRVEAPDEHRPVLPRPSHPLSVLISALAVGALAVYELGRLKSLIATPLTDIDMLAFHLPGIARWIQTGTLWQVNQFLPGFATDQYPHNGDFLILSSVLPWHDLAFARLPAFVFFVLTGLAVYALALELGAARAAAATFAALALVVFPIAQFGLQGLPDDITFFMLGAGLVFLVRHARTRNPGELMLGGLAIGLGLGTKWFGLTAAVPVFVVWIGAGLLAREPVARVARGAGLLLLTMAAGGGFWLIRNLVESGNPIYPKTVSLFGLTLFPGSRGDVVDRYGYSIAHYLTNFHILRIYIYPGFKTQMGIAGLVLLVGLLAALVLAWREAGRRLTLALALVTVGICITYIITPGTAYGPKNLPVEGFVTLRWLMPAVITGGAVGAVAAQWLGRWGVLLELGALAGVADGIKLDPTISGSDVIYGVVIALALGLIVLAVRRGSRRSWHSPALAGGLAVAIALVALVALGRLDESQFDKGSYAGADPVFAWIDQHAPQGQRIAYVGSTSNTPGLSPALPLFGPRLGNAVVYIGRPVVHSVELPASRPAFARQLTRGRYGLLAIGLPVAGSTDAWARQLRFRSLARSWRIALYALPGSPFYG
jgi:hypothetical protein